MLTIPTIRIEQQSAKLGYSSQPSQLSIRQPKATFELNTTQPKLEIHSPQGELRIDQSKAWDALGIGGIFGSMTRIYDQAQQYGLEGIGRIASKGDHLAAIHLGGNAIADIAQQEAFRYLPFNYYTYASFDNVDISYTAHKPDIQVTKGTVDLYARMNHPEIHYSRGRIQYEMLQHASLRFIPPQVDTMM